MNLSSPKWHRALPKFYGRLMTGEERAGYYPPVAAGWQYKAGFVVQFHPETDVAAGRLEGRVEHIASCESARFHSLEELLDFIARALAEARDSEQP